MIRLGLRVALVGLLSLPVTAGATGLKTLYQFTQPFGSLGEFTVDKSGLMYGTSTEGGSAGLGTVFSFNPKTKALTILYSFQGGSDGAKPVPGMTLNNGILYGATAAGGPANDGTVFSFDTKTGTETVLHSFSGTDGQTPSYPPTLSADGILYGTTSVGGTSNSGVAYQIKLHSGATKVIFEFSGAAGANPNALTIGSNGLLYGTCHAGGLNLGTLFALDPATSQETVLYTFTSSDAGEQPSYNVVLGQSGLIYGAGGFDLFEFNQKTGAMTNLNAYVQGGPTASLTVDQSGNLYGASAIPSNRDGRVFQYSPATRTASVIWQFLGGHVAQGYWAQGVAVGKNGKLYGTTPYNKVKGQLEYGTIFALTP